MQNTYLNTVDLNQDLFLLNSDINTIIVEASPPPNMNDTDQSPARDTDIDEILRDQQLRMQESAQSFQMK